MPGLSRSVIIAQRGRSYTGAPVFGAEKNTGNKAAGDHGRGQGMGTVTVLYPKPPQSVQPDLRNRAARRRMSFSDGEAGMATAEYAIATLAAVAFAALLVAVLGSGEVRSLLMGLIRSALTLG